MKNRVVIVSAFVDNLIKERQPDTEFKIFPGIRELLNYSEKSFIRADRMFITKDALENSPTTSMNCIIDLLEKRYVRVNNITYISEKDSDELDTVRFLNDTIELNWDIVEGTINREYIVNFICGTLSERDEELDRKVVVRMSQSDYVKMRLQKLDTLDEKFNSEEDELKDIPITENTEVLVQSGSIVTKLVNVVGLSSRNRTIFAFLMAQNLSFKGKTIIVEKDFKYLSLSDITARADIELRYVSVQDLYRDAEGTIEKIKNWTDRLIVITSDEKDDLDYNFVFNLLYCNLENYVDYFIKELDMDEVSPISDYIVVMNNNVLDIIKTVEKLPDGYDKRAKFVAVSTEKVTELEIRDTKALSIFVKKLIQLKGELRVPIFNITSLIMGGESSELYMLVK